LIRNAFLLLFALTPAAARADIPLEVRRSGYEFMGRATQAMQDDESTGPAALALIEGRELWRRRPSAGARSCEDCHGPADVAMKGVAARHPAWDAKRARPVNLEQRINACRTERQNAAPFAWESPELLSLAAYVGRQSRGLPIDVQVDKNTRPFLDAGRALYFRRQGQLNLACSQCHDDRWERKLLGNPIAQAHPTGYPIYRLEWQGLGSLQRRLRNCMAGVRAEPYAFGSTELVDLELYLMWRARGMKLETPAVRP
jgi:sulfur-oxidizing protein SoxA